MNSETTAKQRVEIELSELTEKHDKLCEFLRQPARAISIVGQKQYDLLEKQRGIMNQYKAILGLRLQFWEE